jgi:hypothetical protein
MGGTVEGFVWVTCLSANGSVDSGCVPLLAQSLASEGTSTPLMFSGSYYDVNAKEVLQPPGLFSADASAQPVFYATVGLGSHGPFNPNVCPAAFALGRDGDAGGIVPNIPGSDAGVAMAPGHEQPSADAGAAPSPPQAPAGSASSTPHGSTRSSDSADASTADPRGAAGNRSPNRGCSISDRRRQATPTLPAFAFALGWTLVARSRIRMRRRCKG